MKNRVLLGLLALTLVSLLIFGACAEPEPETPASSPAPTESTPEPEKPAPAPAEKEPIVFKVGFLGPSSGPWGPSGIDYKHGTELAVKHINEDGWFVVGDQKYVLEFHEYDTRGDAKVSVALAQKMVEDGIKVAISIPIEAYKADQEITEAAKIITVGPGLPDWATPDTNYTFCDSWGQWMGHAYRMVCAPTGQENEYTVFKNVNTVAIMQEQNPMTQNLVDGFMNANEIAGNTIEIVYEAAVPSDSTDFSAVATAMKAKDPDLVLQLIGTAGGAQLTVYPQIREAGYTGQLLDGDWVSGRHNEARIVATDAANGLVESCWSLPYSAPTPPDWVVEALGFDPEMRQRYIDGIIAEYGEEYENAGAQHSYGMVYAMVKYAMWSGDPLNTDAIVTEIEKEVMIPGVANGLMWWKETHMNDLPIVLIKLKDIDNETGEFSFDYLGGGRSTTHYTAIDWAKADFSFTIGTQIDCSQQ